jgi:predicted DNA binding protein
MLNVKVRVKYEGDWTYELEQFDVFGKFVATTFRDRRYIGLVSIDTTDQEFSDVIDVIRENDCTNEVTVLEEYQGAQPDRTAATVLIRAQYLEYTPLQLLLYEGYIPYGGFGELHHGEVSYDLLVESRDNLRSMVELLGDYGHVEIERISTDFRQQIVPSITEWHDLFETIPARQRQLLNIAMEQGYYNLPRDITLQELADEAGIAKPTASQHLRKAEQKLMEFFVKYLNLTPVDQNSD